MKKALLVVIVCAFYITMPAQIQTPSFRDISINNIEAGANSDGSLFTSFTEAKFKVPKTGQANAIFASALWMGGIDAGGSLHMAAQTYRQGGTDYWAGPLDATGNTNNTISEKWNYIWRVKRFDIERHILDYADNGIIDNTVPQDILTWPAKGNIEAQGNSSTPNLNITTDMAPFVDVNGDGVYSPRLGDYPLIKGDEALWWVFNDKLSHGETGGTPLGVEVHTMLYGFFAPSDTALNNTLFANFKIINKSSFSYSDFSVGVWTDFDLGCYNNDYIGCDPTNNYYYAYNGVNNDYSCATTGYGTTLGTAYTLLLKGLDDTLGNATGLSSFMYYENDNSIRGNPQNASNFYNYLNAQWKDNTSLTKDLCSGYGGNLPTKYIYPGTPGGGSFPANWSECSCTNVPGDRRGLGVTGKTNFAAGSSVSIDVAYGYYQFGAQSGCAAPLPTTRIQHLQDAFDNDFQNVAGSCIGTNCVWPGDANSDGVANNQDLLNLGIAANATGAARQSANFFWRGQNASPWSQSFSSGVNFNHADCNGNGIVDFDDVDVVDLNYNFTHLKTSAELVSQIDDPAIWFAPSANSFSYGSVVQLPVHLGSASVPADNYYGVAFSINLNPNLIKPNTLVIDFDSCWLGTVDVDLMALGKYQSGQIDIGLCRTDGNFFSSYGQIANVSFQLVDSVPGTTGKLLLPLEISNILSIGNLGQALTLNSENDTLYISGTTNTAPLLSNQLEVSIYPNPTNGTVNLSVPHAIAGTSVTLDIYNAFGALIHQTVLTEPNTVLALSHLSTGVYYIRVASGTATGLKKLMVY